jgi:hypothetical protein
MKRALKLLGVACGMLAVTTTASAGPIGWSYTAEVSYGADYGSDFVVNLASGGTQSFAGELNEFTATNLFSSTVGRRQPLAGSGEYRVLYNFDVHITLTDLATKVSAGFTVPGVYYSDWSYPSALANEPDKWRWDDEGSNFGNFWGGRTLGLGHFDYQVRAYGGGSGSDPFGELDVKIVPREGTTLTPEPGTLALAGLGLASVAGLRLRRRRA